MIAEVAAGAESSAALGTVITPALPAGIVAGQLLVASCVCPGNSTNGRTVTVSAGWVYAGRVYQSGAYVAQAYRVATGTAADTAPTFTWSGQMDNPRAMVVSYSGVDPANPVMSGAQDNITATNTLNLNVFAKAGSVAVVAAAVNNTGVNPTISAPAGGVKRNAATTGALIGDVAIAAASNPLTVTVQGMGASNTAAKVLVLNPDKTFAARQVNQLTNNVAGAALNFQFMRGHVGPGSLAVMFARSTASTATALTAPAGWSTLLASTRPYTTTQWAIFYRELTGSDLDMDAGEVPASATWTAPGGSTTNIIVATLTGHLPGGPYFTGTPSTNAFTSAGNAKFASMTPAAANALLLLITGSAAASTDTYDARSTTVATMNTAGGIASAPGPATITATGDYTHTTAQAQGPDWLFAVNPAVQPPLAPTLVLPANASYRDLAAGDTFDWDLNPASVGDTQTSYALRRKISGAGSYEYWNASTNAWQSTIVWNTDVNTSLTFGSGKWTNGNVYNWSVATATSGGQGAFAADNTVTASTNPTLAVNTPTGTATSASPVVSWTDTLQSGAAQTAYRIIIESGAYGTTPGAGTQLYDSGTVTSGSTSVTPAVTLPNGGTYRVFVRITQTGGQVSSYAYSTFTVVYNAPAQPLVTATWDAGLARAAVVVQGRDNMLTANDASLEGGLGSWVNLANATLAQSATQAADGSQSLRMTAVAAADMSATTAPGAVGYPVVAGETYTGLASFRAGATAKNVRVSLAWYTAAGAFISATDGATVADGTGGFTQATVSGAAPATAAFMAVRVTVLAAAAGGIHYVDKVSVAPGTSTTWTAGGFTPAYLVEQSSDGGATWEVVRASSRALWDSAGDQLATVYDYETPPNTARRYRATSLANYADPTTLVASPVSASTADVTAALDGAWLKDPLNPDANVALACLDGLTWTRGRNTETLQPLGARYPVVQSDVRRVRTGSVAVTPATQAEDDAINALLDLPARTLLLQRPPSSSSWRGVSVYFVVTGEDTATPLGDVPLDANTIAFPIAEVPTPAVP